MNSPCPQLIHRSDAPVLALDQSWETGSFTTAVSVIPDPEDGYLRLYYLVRNKEAPLKNVLCLARSRDGKNWTKPDCGAGNNVVMHSSGNRTGWGAFMPTTILHDAYEANPDLRWKMIYWDRPDPALPAGICLAGSRDGLGWTACQTRPIIINANDAGSAILTNPAADPGPRASPVRIYQQTWKYNPELPIDRDNLKMMHRVISIWTSDTFTGNWVGPTLILEPDRCDPPDLQFYWLVPFHTTTGYGGLLNCHHTGNQTMDIQLVSSRDGWTWHRRNDRQPLLPLGDPGRYDCGMVSAVSRPVLWNDRALLYFNARASVHDHQDRYPGMPQPDPAQGIGLAEFTPDLFHFGPT